MSIIEQANELLKNYGTDYKVPAIIDGKPYALSETQVRALQVLCKEYAEKHRFIEFIMRVQIFSSFSKGAYLMEWRPDGRFFNEFEGHFFTRNSELTFEIL